MRAVRNFLKGCNSCPEFLPARLASEPCTPLKPSFQPQLYNSWSALRDLHVRPGRASPSPTSPHSLQLHTQEMYAHSSGLVKLKGFQVTRPGLIIPVRRPELPQRTLIACAENRGWRACAVSPSCSPLYYYHYYYHHHHHRYFLFESRSLDVIGAH